MINQRYSRQIMLPEIGEEGQKRLNDASVLIVGAGGLGSASSLYLAAAGVGRLVIADADEVRIHNLNRQILYSEADLGCKKSEKAKDRLSKFNSDIKIDTVQKISTSNIHSVLVDKKIDVVVDGTDNFETRYVVNEACAMLKIPFVYGSVAGFEGQVSVFDVKNGPCYECVFPEAPPEELAPTCIRAGILGSVAGFIGTLQAGEAIRLILQMNYGLIGKIFLADLKKMNFRTVDVVKDPHCNACS